MATTILRSSPPRSLAPNTFEKVLAAGATLLGVAVVAAVLRGREHWGEVPLIVWLHLLTIGIAVALTPTLLLSARGTRRHRRLGQVWVAAMLTTAALSFGIREIGAGAFSAIHILSGAMLVMVPALWIAARRHRVERHRSIVRGVVTGALLAAGFFTFPFNRLLGGWLFG